MNNTSYTGNNRIGGLVQEALALTAQYPPERIYELAKTDPNDHPEDVANLGRMIFILENELPLQLAARLADNLELTKDGLFTLCEDLIKLGIAHNNKFNKSTCLFLSNQLWGLDIAPFSQEEGVAWIQAKLTDHGGDQEFVAELVECKCPSCVSDGLTSQIQITNEAFREANSRRHLTIIGIMPGDAFLPI